MGTKPPYVVIVGAGLGGLCLAQGLRKRGLTFDVFERDESPYSRTQGYRIRIDHHGQQALNECLPPSLYELFRSTSALPVSGIHVLDPQLNDVADRWVNSWKPPAGAEQPEVESAESDDLNVHRLTLREVLMSGIEEHIHFGKAFSHYQERDDGKVVAHFSDGSTVIADILVAADGVHSAVRRQRLAGWEPVDTGSVCIYGKTYLTAATRATIAGRLPDMTSVIFDDGASVIVDAMNFRPMPVAAPGDGHPLPLSAVEDYLYWAIIGTRARFGLSTEHPLEFDRAALAALVSEITQPWAPGLAALFDLAEPSSMAMVAVRSSAVPRHWEPSRVTVLGDAIHVMSPAGGLGANTALRDAALLAERLGGGRPDQPLSECIGDYETRMRTYSAVAIDASIKGARVLFGQGVEV